MHFHMICTIIINNNNIHTLTCINTGVSKFRVHMKESEHVPVSGPVDLIVSEDGITLLSIQTGNREKINILQLQFLHGT